jgi:Inner membrane component domain
LLFGGVWMAIAWGVAAVIMAITIIGLPWARAAFNIGVYTLLPFGFKAVDRDEHLGRGDIGTGPLGVLGNIVWLVLAGWWLALGHVLVATCLGSRSSASHSHGRTSSSLPLHSGPLAKSSCPRTMLRLDILGRDRNDA